MMPACTGLPPGELISSTTAWRLCLQRRCAWRPRSVRRWPRTRGNFTLDLDQLRCAVSRYPPPPPRSMPTHTSATKNASQARRMPLRQRRAWRCSVMAARPGLPAWRAPSLGRRQTLALAEPDCFIFIASCAYSAGAGADLCHETLVDSGWGSVISELNRLQVGASMPVHDAVALAQRYLDQSAAAGAPRHSPFGSVHGAMRGTHQPTAGAVEKTVGLVVHFHRNMGALVQVGIHLAFKTDGKAAEVRPQYTTSKGTASPLSSQVRGRCTGQWSPKWSWDQRLMVHQPGMQFCHRMGHKRASSGQRYPAHARHNSRPHWGNRH
jgi:hypothetical protein